MKKLKQLIYTAISLMIVSVLLSANVLAEETGKCVYRC